MNFENTVITEIAKPITVYIPQKKYSETKERPCYALCVCIDEGQITWVQNGIEYTGDKMHAVILPEGQSFTSRGIVSGNFIAINFCTLAPLTDTIMVFKVRDNEFIVQRCNEMKQIFTTSGNRAKIFSLMYEIFSELHPKQENSMLLPAIDYIHEHYFENQITNACLARRCNISEVYFRKLFTAQFGVSPQKFILSLRLRRAKQLLAEGNDKVSWIAEHCGFDSTAHFCRIFKAKVGSSAGEYRKENRISKI